MERSAACRCLFVEMFGGGSSVLMCAHTKQKHHVDPKPLSLA